MPDLLHSLLNRDIGHLRIVAGLWGVELKSAETQAALEELSAALMEPRLVQEMVDTLPTDARSALETLVSAGGKISWATFTRQSGELREAGPGRRDREQIHLHPTSAAETLFYRALLARAFFDTPSGAKEFAYIPDDLYGILSSRGGTRPISPEILGRPATAKERAHPLPAYDRLLDDATTLLAALRMSIEPPETGVPVGVLGELMQAAGIQADHDLQPEKVKAFLEMPRRQAISMLSLAWEESASFNELRQVPGLICEGEWSNPPRETRMFVIDRLNILPKGKWWSLPAFIQDIKEKHPDFQRPAGDYDSWIIKRKQDGVFLRGFSSWDEVDGEVIRYLITGPLCWLQRLELAKPEGNESYSAFRLPITIEGEKAGQGAIISGENGKVSVSSNGRIAVQRLVPRPARYQIARFCEWDEARPEVYHYRVTSASLKKAGQQGLKVGQLLPLLAKNAASEIPPAFVKALKRWEVHGSEARIEAHTILKVSRPEMLEEIQKSKAGRFLGESLGPVTAVVKPGAKSKILTALAEAGLLTDVQTESDENKRA